MLSVFEGDSLEEIWSGVHDAFRDLRKASNVQDIAQSSRVGSTLELLHSVIHLSNPRQRWAYSRSPALNPAFALAEVIWILGGREDTAFPNSWNPILPKFAGDGTTYHGAYGYRLRQAHGIDQLQRAYEVLKNQPDNRQVVLQIWQPQLDMPSSEGTSTAPDIPCNISSLLKIRGGRLEWTQVMRSNDFYRGFPYNVVQWTSVQEVMAGWLGVEVGSYVHFSDSLHVYEEHWGKLEEADSFEVTGANWPLNTDNLSLSKPDFDAVFPDIERRAEAMTKGDLTPDSLASLVDYFIAPAAYQNVLRVLAADSARRRGWETLTATVMEGCTNPALTQLWDDWAKRQGEPAPSNKITA